MADGVLFAGIPDDETIIELLLTEIRNLRASCGTFQKKAAEQDAKIRELADEVARLRAAQFTSKAERDRKIPRDVDPSQLCMDLGPAAESSAPEAEPSESKQSDKNENEVQLVLRRKPRRKPAGKKLSLSQYVNSMEPREVVTTTEDGRICEVCSSEMSVLAYDSYRELVVVPADIYVREIRVPTYSCRSCDATGTMVPVVHSPLPVERPIPRCLASPETVAWLIYQKAAMGLPLYRMCRFFEEFPAPVNRTTLANWMIAASFRFLIPLAECFRQKLVAYDIVHADETTFQVLKEPERAPEKKGYMWIYCSTYGVGVRYVALDYSATRAAKEPEKFLEGFEGMIQCDGYSGCESLTNKHPMMTRVGCWAHVRRKWYEAARRAGPESAARTGYDYVQKLFELEEKFSDMSPEERRLARLDQVKPHLDKFAEWLKNQYSGETLLGKAVTYTRNQWPALINYLSDGRLQATNAAAELIAKDFAVGRKNFLFSNSLQGARALAAAYSVVETARANHIGVYKYLTWIISAAAPGIAFVEAGCEPALKTLDWLEMNELEQVRSVIYEELSERPPLDAPVDLILDLVMQDVKIRYVHPLRQELEDQILMTVRARWMSQFLPDMMPRDWDPSKIGELLPHRRV